MCAGGMRTGASWSLRSCWGGGAHARSQRLPRRRRARGGMCGRRHPVSRRPATPSSCPPPSLGRRCQPVQGPLVGQVPRTREPIQGQISEWHCAEDRRRSRCWQRHVSASPRRFCRLLRSRRGYMCARPPFRRVCNVCWPIHARLCRQPAGSRLRVQEARVRVRVHVQVQVFARACVCVHSCVHARTGCAAVLAAKLCLRPCCCSPDGMRRGHCRGRALVHTPAVAFELRAGLCCRSQ